MFFESERNMQRTIESGFANEVGRGAGVVRAMAEKVFRNATKQDEKTGEAGYLRQVWNGAKIKMAARLQQWIRPRR